MRSHIRMLFGVVLLLALVVGSGYGQAPNWNPPNWNPPNWNPPYQPSFPPQQVVPDRANDMELARIRKDLRSMAEVSAIKPQLRFDNKGSDVKLVRICDFYNPKDKKWTGEFAKNPPRQQVALLCQAADAIEKAASYQRSSYPQPPPMPPPVFPLSRPTPPTSNFPFQTSNPLPPGWRR